MTLRADILCFLCGAKVMDPPEIPELEDGSECPACRDRLLDALPPLLPCRGQAPRSSEDDPADDADDDGDPRVSDERSSSE